MKKMSAKRGQLHFDNSGDARGMYAFLAKQAAGRLQQFSFIGFFP
jgi:hypothetical protein